MTVPIDQGTVTFDLPADWEVHRASINNRPPLTADQIRTALRETIGTPALRELARGRRTAVLIVDDLTRPTPTADFIPYVLEEIHAGGIPPEGTVILGGFATHRPMTRPEYVRKVGAEVVARYEYMNHNPFEHLVDVGTTSRGTKVAVNKYYADADLRISLSSVIPHASAGFGGGAKLVLPGVCGIETIAYHHGTFDGERVQIEATSSGPTARRRPAWPTTTLASTCGEPGHESAGSLPAIWSQRIGRRCGWRANSTWCRRRPTPTSR